MIIGLLLGVILGVLIACLWQRVCCGMDEAFERLLEGDE